MEKDLVTYKITIDSEYSDGEDLGIDQIAFTATPAILTKGFAFNDTKVKFLFKDDAKQRIVAPALIPMNIYRNDDMGEYFVQFSAEEIEKIRGKFMQNLQNSNVFNLEHDNKKTVPAFVLETWLVGKDPKADRSYSEFGIDVPSGTMMVMAQVTNKEYYNNLVKEEKLGFSIEGFLGLKLSEIINKNKFNMDLNNKVHELEIQLAEALAKLAEATKTDKTDEEIATETTETEDTELAEDTSTDTTTDTTTTDTETETKESVINPEEVMSIVQPKLDELMAIIADLQAKMEDDTVEDETTITDTKMSAQNAINTILSWSENDSE